MGHKFAEIDNKLRKQVTVEVVGNDFLFPSGNGGVIEFQFPPLISSSAKTSNWSDEGHATVAWEPITVWKGAAAKKVNFKAIYIVTGGTWNAEKIDGILKEFSRVHYGQAGGEDQASAIGSIPNYRVNIYNTVIGRGAQFKIKDVSIEYSDTLVVDRSVNTQGQRTNKVYPLKSTLTWTGDLVTRINDKQQVAGDINAKIPLPEWY